ncbi:MAG: ATP-binding protein [Fibromonadales bacterium]|nr:ATP-binding protein [Fibromonadales bacterium]
MTRNFQQNLILRFLLIFTICTLCIAVFEQQALHQYKRDSLQETLDTYVDVIAKYIAIENRDESLKNLLALLPGNLRITLLDSKNNVLYDNVIPDYSALENHAERPEIIAAMNNGNGSVLRNSTSNNTEYLYYAKKVNDKIIRVALPYDEQVQFLLKPNSKFLYFVAAVFLIGFAFILYVGNYFGKSIRQLRDFSQRMHNGDDNVVIPKFPKNELSEISIRIVNDLNRIKEDEKRLAQEKEKLLLHLQASAEGICFFNADKTVAFYNGLFLQYFNIISHISITIGKEILSDESFNPVIMFLNNNADEDYFETHISSQGRNFLLRMNVFEDKSFEIILVDITAKEKTRRLKQEMTGNIAHELRTPVTSISGFLEILLNNNIAAEKRQEYLQRAFAQTKILSELISDMSLLTKIDGKAQSLHLENVNVSRLIAKVYADISAAMEEKGVKINSDIPQDIVISGNSSLLYSIFRNLADNVLRHAGSNVDIDIKVHEIKEGKVYFIFADNGKGIEDESHLNRLFERFYRVHEGRTRDTGGSGLGLSIVKNAVLFHGGTISVRKGKEKGLEFLFSLPLAKDNLTKS